MLFAIIFSIRRNARVNTCRLDVLEQVWGLIKSQFVDFERTVSNFALSSQQDILSGAGVYQSGKASVEKIVSAGQAHIFPLRRFFIYCKDLHRTVNSQFILFLGHGLDKYCLDRFSCSKVDLKFAIRCDFGILFLANGCSEAAVDELTSSAVGRVNRSLIDYCVGQD